MKRCARQADGKSHVTIRTWLVLLCALVTAWCAPATGALAKDEEEKPTAPPARFYEQEPYDVIVLDDSTRTRLKVLPLELPGGKVPAAPKPTDKLRIRRFDDPDEEYDIQWQDIVEVKLFDQAVLDEAKKLVAAGKFNEAFDYFGFLRHEYPKCVGLDDAVADFLYAEAGDWQRKRKYENALVLLHSLYERQPQRPGLEKAMASATGKLLEKYFAEEDYSSVRKLVRALRKQFPSGTAAAGFEAQMNERAVKVVNEGRVALDAGDAQQGLALARHAMAIWPKADGAKQLAEEAFAAFPHVVVAVTTPYSQQLTEPITDWSVRRTQRILQRDLFEFTGYGADGGEYVCPLGSWEITDLGRGMAINVTPGIAWLRDGKLSGYDLARRLLELAQPGRSDFLPAWAEACRSVEVSGVDRVTVHFREPHLVPAALLTVAPTNAESGIPPSIVPYTRPEVSGDRLMFRLDKDYFARGPAQPQGIIEQRFATRLEAVEALRVGEVTIVDRLPPWQVGALKSAVGIAVEPYSVPTVHCLVPNLARPFMRNRGFRRALVYGINRPKILSEQILKRQTLAGCEVISAPFSKGTGLSDPAGYAYDDDIPPRPYEPRLALTLSAVALRDVSMNAEPGSEHVKELPKLVLAHPADDVARLACKAIQQDLEILNFKVELREIPLGQPNELAPTDDLLYVELAVQEPLVEARRLFGQPGLLGSASTYMSLVLRQVETATGWNEARQALHDLHRLTYDEVSVVPLWQITEHFAYQKSLAGITPRPASLYQGVEKWQPSVPLPAEEP
ncbi:MAG TPA: ABC transporter substrate-binding protein [Pirellulales bacterium]|nr:ABC transporter substrate-binding protein [Pirellulales bacterium]